MENIPKNLPWLALNDKQSRQYVDASAAFAALEAARKAQQEVRGGMYWKTGGGSDYLIRTSPANSQKSLGPRSPETEAIHARFVERKSRAESRVRSLREAVAEHQRINRALRLGRVPAIVIDILNAIDAARLSGFFTVVGTHALYAYEAAAGVQLLEGGALATQDIDLLWDTRKRLLFLNSMQQQGLSMINLLRKVDASFEILPAQKYTAVNGDGFEVDVLRRPRAENDPHPLQLTDHEDDFWVLEAENAGVLMNAPGFSAVVMDSRGRMARMNTISPVVFARFKRWLSGRPGRDPLKRSRDMRQAELVEQLIEEFIFEV